MPAVCTEVEGGAPAVPSGEGFVFLGGGQSGC